MALGVLSLVTKSLNIVDAGLNITVVALDKDRTGRDTLNAVVQGVFAGCQTADIIARNVCQAPPKPLNGTNEKPPSNWNHYSTCELAAKIQLATSTTTGLMDGFRSVTSIAAKAEKTEMTPLEITMAALQAVGVVTFRAGDIAGAMKEVLDSPEHKKYCENIEQCALLAGNVVSLAGASLKFYLTAPQAYLVIKNYVVRRESEENQRRLQLKPYVRQALGIANPPAEAVTHAPINPIQGQPAPNPNSPVQERPISFADEPDAKIDHVARQEVVNKLIANINSLDKIDVIPQFLVTNFTHPTWPRCKITGNPIRHIAVPKATCGLKTNVRVRICYELQTLRDAIANNKVVPGWPQGFPLKESSIDIDESLQASVDNYLEDMINELIQDAVRLR